MNDTHRYSPTDKMSDLICDNFSLLMVMSRFGLSLGFGDKSVRDVCLAQGVDWPTFLAVANFVSEEQYTYSEEESHFSLASLMDYLKRAHSYFLDYNLPDMRQKLQEAIACDDTNEVAGLIMKFYDEYVEEVRRHMEYENRQVFTYVDRLLDGHLDPHYDIATFAGKHNQIETRLKELKNIIIKYYPEQENNNRLNAVLFDIFNCEKDLAQHCQVEDYLFVPAVAQLEHTLTHAAEATR
ncbi:MAG: hemerythrin domain-containing protein [Prevotellaceae bacterium]|jgi:regulator of cell morphogenesis and NO signaling|nr:hemerythrin domain-containing protein [Prevotellaceae bacterium]